MVLFSFQRKHIEGACGESTQPREVTTASYQLIIAAQKILLTQSKRGIDEIRFGWPRSGTFHELQLIPVLFDTLYLPNKNGLFDVCIRLTSKSDYGPTTGNPGHVCIIYHMIECVQIYVRGYPKRVGEQDLKKLFSRYGKVQDVRLMYDFAFVALSSRAEAEAAVSGINGTTEFDSTLKVEMAKGSGLRTKCWNCGEAGHRSNICPKPKVQKVQKHKEDESDSSSSSERKRKKKKSKKISKHRKRSRSRSSSSSSSSSPSSSSSSSRS